MTTIAEMLMALQANDTQTKEKLAALEAKLAASREKANIRALRSYHKRRAEKMAAPNYVTPKNGRPFAKKEEHQAATSEFLQANSLR